MGTRKDATTATTSCLGVRIGPSWGALESLLSWWSLMESLAVKHARQGQNPQIIGGQPTPG